jgi:hypothetical protein
MSEIRDWEKSNCRLTWGSALVYLSPVFWMVAAAMGEPDPNVWRGGVLLTVPLGIWLSRGTWRRVLGLMFLIALMVFGHNRTEAGGYVPAWLIISWFVTFQFVYYMDGQAKFAKGRAKEGWE